MKVKHQGSARVKRAQLQRLQRTFETLEMKAGEGVAEYFARVMNTTNDMRNCRENVDDVKIVEKIHRSLIDNFNFVVCSIEESKDIDRLTVDELQASLKIHVSGMLEGEENGLPREEEAVIEDEGAKSFVNRSAINCFQCAKQGHYQFECTSLEK